MLNLPDTLFYSLKSGLGIQDFRSTWPYLIADLANWAKFLEPSGYCTVIKCTFIFCTTNVFGCFHSVIPQFELIKHKFLHCMFISRPSKPHRESSYAQHICTPTTTTQATTESTFYGLNYVGHVIYVYVPQISIY